MYIIYDIYYKYNAYIAYIFQFDLVTLLLMSFPRRILFGFIIKTRRVSIGGIVSLYMYIWREVKVINSAYENILLHANGVTEVVR